MSRDDLALQPFRVQVVDFTEALAELRAVRDEVFVEEQQVPVELEHDALDPQCTHVIARLLDGTPVGTARLTPDHHVGRMAVRAPWRGRGVGDALLLVLVEEARKRGWTEVRLNSQVSAIGFYERHGFRPEGERFMEAGIEHQAMVLAFTGPARIDSREAGIDASIGIIERARRSLWIRSVALDPWLYDDGNVLQALRGFATRGGQDRPGLRVSPHFYNSPAEVDRLLTGLSRSLKTGV